MISVSLRPGDRLISTDLSFIPAGASLDSYRNVLGKTGFLMWLWNSLVITCVTSLVGVSLASTAAYAFSRFKFPGSKLGLLLLLGTQMIPASMLLLPLFLMIVRLGLINTYLGMIIAYSVSSLPFSIWLLKGYYDTIPRSLEEAALGEGRRASALSTGSSSPFPLRPWLSPSSSTSRQPGMNIWSRAWCCPIQGCTPGPWGFSSFRDNT